MRAKRLDEIGEFRLIRDVVLPALGSVSPPGGLGDDTAGIRIPDSAMDLVVTTDSVGEPLVFEFGIKNYALLGWLSVVMNLSDIAAAGANPIGFVSCVEAAPSSWVSDFADLFDGMATACKFFGVVNAGGNVRAGRGFACHGTAFGLVERNRRLMRSGCNPGDLLVAVGRCGMFAAAYLVAKSDGIERLEPLMRRVLEKPEPRIREMCELNSRGLVSAASDCSDGVLGALWNIAEASEIGIEVILDEAIIDTRVLQAALRAGVDPWNLMFFWGDWQVICSVRPGDWSQAQQTAERLGFPIVRLGTATPGPVELRYKRGEKVGKLRLLRNESFTQASYASGGIEAADFLLHTPIYD